MKVYLIFDEMIENAVENIETLTIDQNYKKCERTIYRFID